MKYTVMSARFANPDNAVAVLQTAEAGAVVTSQRDTPHLWALLEGVAVAAYVAPVPPEPSPLEKIRAIENAPTVADAMVRANRLVALAYAIDELIRVAASKGQVVTREQAHAWAIVNDSNYRTLYEAEQAIKPLRALV